MKKSLLLAGLLFTLTFAVNAQQKKNVVVIHRVSTMNELGLNEEQQAKITALTQQSSADIKKIKENKKNSESANRKAISKVYVQRQKDYETVLTPEQLKKYNELKEAAKKQ